MMEVEDDNVYIKRMTTNVSGDSGLEGQSQKKFYGPVMMDVLLWKYYELQIRILTSGTDEIVKLTEESDKYTLMKTFTSQFVIKNCQEIFASNTKYLQNVFFQILDILDISHIHLSFKGVLQYIVYNVYYAWQQHNLVIVIYAMYTHVYYHITYVFIR